MNAKSPSATDSVLARVAAGDSSAVQECIDQYSGLVWSIARDLTRTTQDAEDAVQEVFLSVWKNASRFDPSKASEKTFVAMIARRRLIDSLRKQGRRPKLVAFPEEGPDPADDSHLATQHGAEAAVAKKLLAELRPEQRQVIELSVYQGMSHSEIANATQIPVGTVKSHIWRGLNSVRSRLAELEDRSDSVTA